MDFDIDKWWQKNKTRFHYYDPFLTYSKSDNDVFIKIDGKPDRELNPDTDALFSIGKEAFFRLSGGEELSRKEFYDGYASYLKFLDEMRSVMSEMNASGKLVSTNERGDHISVDFLTLEDTQVMPFCWKIFSQMPAGVESREIYREVFLFHALREVDSALIGIALDGRDAVAGAIGASNALSNAIAIESGSDKEQEIRREIGYRGALEKLKRDPKQKAKSFVRECWLEWQENPERYKGQAKFARDMLEKCPDLESQVSIENWCREWKKASSS